MKKILLLSYLLLFVFAVNAQFANPGFEQKINAGTDQPKDWNLVPVEGYTATLTDQVKHSGIYSLKMVGNPTDPSKYMNVTQTLAVNYPAVKRIKVTAYIKTENLKGNVAMWCQIWGENKKRIGFENSGSQGLIINGTADWQKYSMTLVVSKETKNLYLGAYAMGTGTVWFDDFAIEEMEGGNEEPTAEVLKFSKEFNDIVKKNSIYTDSINWQVVDDDLKSLAKGLKTIADAQILNNYVLAQLKKAGDNHSFIQNKVGAQNYASGNTVAIKPTAKILPNGIGYVSVPAYGSINKEAGEEFASSIQTLIKTLDQENDIKGWVVDLRTNGGGNMYPMISGLGPFLDLGDLGYFIKGNDRSAWKNTKTGMGVNVKDPYQLKNKDNKIAVLIGPRTASSGEMTAITFIGQRNVKLFGEPSAGYVTANRMFKLSDGSNLLLASSYVADRNQKKYLDRIYPDVVVKSTADKDEVLQSSIDWLEKK